MVVYIKGQVKYTTVKVHKLAESNLQNVGTLNINNQNKFRARSPLFKRKEDHFRPRANRVKFFLHFPIFADKLDCL
jgi:hypothetical protein